MGGAAAMIRMRKFVFGAVLIAGACIVLWALALSKPSPAISMRVRGFTTNRYVFPNDPDPDFIYAIIEVTNRSRRRFLTHEGLWDSFLLPNVPGNKRQSLRAWLLTASQRFLFRGRGLAQHNQ